MRDLFALSSDYDGSDKATQMFYAETQNKLLYAFTGKTAAEIRVSRANASEPNMVLTNWKGTVARKQDIFIAKNYLQEDELDSLNRLVAVFLETAELRAKNRRDITIGFWRDNVDRIIGLNDMQMLQHSGNVSNAEMEKAVEAVYSVFNAKRKSADAEKADRQDLDELNTLEKNLGKRTKG